MRLLEAQASLLSVPPVFDETTGEHLLAASKEWLKDLQGDHVGDPFVQLRLAGLLVEWRGVMRISDSIRDDLRRRLATESPGSFKRCAGVFAVHARNGFQQHLELVMGRHSANVSVAVMDTLSASDGDTAGKVDALVSLVQAHPSAGRSIDTVAATRQLESVPDPSTEVDRAIRFLKGLDAWRNGDRLAASRMFIDVLHVRAGDTAEAVAGHLLGVALGASGETQPALTRLRAAADLLRLQDDDRGLAQTLTSLGRILRGAALAANSAVFDAGNDLLLEAETVLREAIAASRGDRQLEGGARLEMARVAIAREDREYAQELVERALVQLEGSDEHMLDAYTLLAGLHRDLGAVKDADHALSEATTLAEETGIQDLSLARLLNVQASADRKAGRRRPALEHARSSLAIGQRLGNRRHMAHASNTLALILMDQRSATALNEASLVIGRAIGYASAIGDETILARVRATAERCRELRDKLPPGVRALPGSPTRPPLAITAGEAPETAPAGKADFDPSEPKPKRAAKRARRAASPN